MELGDIISDLTYDKNGHTEVAFISGISNSSSQPIFIPTILFNPSPQSLQKMILLLGNVKWKMVRFTAAELLDLLTGPEDTVFFHEQELEKGFHTIQDN